MRGNRGKGSKSLDSSNKSVVKKTATKKGRKEKKLAKLEKRAKKNGINKLGDSS
jgi:hypothetical protein